MHSITEPSRYAPSSDLRLKFSSVLHFPSAASLCPNTSPLARISPLNRYEILNRSKIQSPVKSIMKVRKRKRDSESGSPEGSAAELSDLELSGENKEQDGSLQAVDSGHQLEFAGFASNSTEIEKAASLGVDDDPMVAVEVTGSVEKKELSLEAHGGPPVGGEGNESDGKEGGTWELFASDGSMVALEKTQEKGDCLEGSDGSIVAIQIAEGDGSLAPEINAIFLSHNGEHNDRCVIVSNKNEEKDHCFEAANGSFVPVENTGEKDGSLAHRVDAEHQDGPLAAVDESVTVIESSQRMDGSLSIAAEPMVIMDTTEEKDILLEVAGDPIMSIEDANKTLLENVGDCSVLAGPKKPPVPRSSSYHGVTKHRWSGKFEAHLWDGTINIESRRRKGKQVYLGGYDSEQDAARAYDLAALKYWGVNPNTKLNFPVSEYEKELEEMKSMSQDEWVQCLRRRSRSFSRGISAYRGVTRRGKDGKWQARLGSVAGTRAIFLGAFDTEEEAAIAYDIGLIKLRGLNAITNFDISNYADLLDER